MTTPIFCHPEFGCDCQDVIGGLELELAEALNELRSLKAGQQLNAAVDRINGHRECGSTCTPECMRMTL